MWNHVVTKKVLQKSVFVRRRVGERIIFACVVPTVTHGGGGVMMWGCFAGDTVIDLFRIHCTLNPVAYRGGYSMLMQYATGCFCAGQVQSGLE